MSGAGPERQEDEATDGWALRATTEQVDDVLLNISDPRILDICHDWLDMAAHEATLQSRIAAAERVIEAAQEAVVRGDVYRRALADELRRMAPDEPLQIDPMASVHAGGAVGRFRSRLDAYDAATRTEEAP